MKNFWQGLGRGARLTLVGGALAIIGIVAILGIWALSTDYDVLFNNLSGPDAAAMTAELDRIKQPYKLGPDGTSILVDRQAVHKVRLKLMGKDLPLHGAVGFELFNNSDFGMTEFAQKVNYQRALQGEITRTIMSLDEVDSARVHLAMPEDRLFKNEQNRPKASIRLGLRNGRVLRNEQVAGIQRLVAAAVPGILMQDVTIVNQEGVALTRAGSAEGAPDSGTLDLKRDIERHLAHKATEVLERAFGPGGALVSVDAVLDMNQLRVTKEEVVGAPGRPEETAAGVVVRERESIKDAAPEAAGAGSGTSVREVEYQVGRRVEQLVSQPGSIIRLQVVAVLKTPIDANREEQAKALLGAAVGASKERGDIVVVQALHSLVESPATPIKDELASTQEGSGVRHDMGAADNGRTPFDRMSVVIGLAGTAMCLSLTVAVVLVVRAARGPHKSSVDATPMNAPERAAALAKIRSWLGEESPQPPSRRTT
jgi:flagellar M-ring protein FliF